MRIGSTHYRSIWTNGDPGMVNVIDQRKLPFEFDVFEIQSPEDAFFAIRHMVVRGGQLIGVTAAYGIFLAGFHSRIDDWQTELKEAEELLLSSRPSVSNLKHVVEKMLGGVNFAGSHKGMIERLQHMANRLAESEVLHCKEIGDHGLALIKDLYAEKGKTINILMHSNSGWLSSVDYGIVTAPIFLAHEQGIPLHIWVDETRPRNLDARLTTFELREQGVPHAVIVENEAGYRMQNGEVDMVLVGANHISPEGDVASKVGTYLKALAARDNGIPFYVALASTCLDGQNGKRKGSPVELAQADKREERSLIYDRFRILQGGEDGSNPDFDITPAHLVTGLITEQGLCDASESAIKSLFKNSMK